MSTATPPFEKFLRDHVQTVPGNMLAKFEVRSLALTVLELLAFNAAAQRHTQTHIERKQYLRHSLCSLGGDNNNNNILA